MPQPGSRTLIRNRPICAIAASRSFIRRMRRRPRFPTTTSSPRPRRSGAISKASTRAMETCASCSSRLDDRYVIMNAGDELALRFAAPPPPPAGWVRDYVIAGDGWVKDGDYNSTFSRTVQPLPYHARTEYDTPPGQLEDEWVYRHHPEDWQTYQTRYVTADTFRNALQTGRHNEESSNCTNPRHSVFRGAARSAVDGAPFLCSGKGRRQSRHAGRARSLRFLASGSVARSRHRFCSPGAHARFEARRHHA